MIALLFALLLQQGTAPRRAASPPVRVGVRVEPETVTVGDPFTVLLRVRGPAGATIEFPAGPDSGAAVELLSQPRFSAARADTTSTEQLAGYRLAAWDVGSQPLRFADIVVRVGAVERRLPLRGYTVFVRSVLPADTTLHVPKPARALFVFAFPWWILIVLAAIAALLAAWWLWRAWRRRRGRPLPPAVEAEREFVRIEAMRLPDRDDGARHVALMTDVLRVYLAARILTIWPSHTSSQLLTALRASQLPALDHASVARFERLLARADAAKFAATPIAPDEARSLGAEARSLVADVEQRMTIEEQRKAA